MSNYYKMLMNSLLFPLVSLHRSVNTLLFLHLFVLLRAFSSSSLDSIHPCLSHRRFLLSGSLKRRSRSPPDLSVYHFCGTAVNLGIFLSHRILFYLAVYFAELPASQPAPPPWTLERCHTGSVLFGIKLKKKEGRLLGFLKNKE